MFLFWRKYEGSWIATAVSIVGSFFITIGSIFLAFMVGAVLEQFFDIENSFLLVLCIIIAGIAGLVAYIPLKTWLNKLTDKIDNLWAEQSIETSITKLFQPSWRSDNKHKATKALENITSQAKLKRIALGGYSFWHGIPANVDICVEAAKRLTNQANIIHVVRESHYEEAKLIAIDKLTGPASVKGFIKLYSKDLKKTGLHPHYYTSKRRLLHAMEKRLLEIELTNETT
ncbi:MAG: hypothetical protein FWD03_03815 [Defluviitaleaceae bacterium]|nr:hypothetical protein [Defluviitaleaceae bacterium]